MLDARTLAKANIAVVINIKVLTPVCGSRCGRAYGAFADIHLNFFRKVFLLLLAFNKSKRNSPGG